MSNGERYTPEELALIESAVKTKSSWDDIAAQIPGRTGDAIRRTADKRGFARYRELAPDSLRKKVNRAQRAPRIKITPDERFQRLMREAINAGREHAICGVDKRPCTVFPRPICGEPLIFIRSVAGLAADQGEKAGAFDPA